MSKARGGLGRGLNALIPSSTTTAKAPPEEAVPQQPTSAEPTEQKAVPEIPARQPDVRKSSMLTVAIQSIAPNPYQPRKHIDPEILQELSNSIKVHGLVQPPVVSINPDYDPDYDGKDEPPLKEGEIQKERRARYLLIAGERRWQASKLAGLVNIPVVLKETTPLQMLELALVENIQRADLNPLEEAFAYRQLVSEFKLTQEQVADKVGKSRTAVTNSLRLLDLPKEALESLNRNEITEGHARALLMVKDTRDRLRLLKEVIDKALSVRQTEEAARRINTAAAIKAVIDVQSPDDKAKRAADIETKTLEQNFRDALRAQVQLSRSKKGGKLTIQFGDDEELDWIYRKIMGDDYGI